ncbi:MAG: endonuclease [Colwellia sp.]|nr:endonuclease [Colwellia sp.]
MKKLSILMCGFLSLNAVADVVITEYVEGGGYNKALEITNLGTTEVALGSEGYTLSLYTNGSAEPSSTYSLYGILVPNSSLVIYNSGLTVASSFESPLGLSDNSVLNHNGDDAYVLKKGDEIVDSFGQVGIDPGSYWGTSSDNSKDHTLRRKVGITTGDKDPSDAYDPTISEWTFFDKDTLDGLGCTGEGPCTGNEPLPLLEGDPPPVDSCIFTRCDEVPKVNLRADYVESTYYIKANAAIDSELSIFKQAIHQDIKVGHTQLTYNQVWTALIDIDEDPNNSDNVNLLYTGKSIAKTENASVKNNAPDSWNREHVWSKSHGFPNSSQLGYTDIHHLRPADASINSLRSNYDFDNGGSPANDGSIVTENNVLSGVSWEPRDAVKGDVARMMFYMAVRYEENSDNDMPDLVLVDSVNTDGAEFGKLCSLYQWHENDPVDAQEVERNHGVYEFQGNRNPFIDHPEWVEKVYGAQCNVSNVPLPTVSVDTIEVAEGANVSLTANVNVSDLTFEWSQQSGVSVTLSAADSSMVSFDAPSVDSTQTVVLSVTVTDQQGNQATTTVDITITDVPEVIPEDPPTKKSSSGGSLGFSFLAFISLLLLRNRAFIKRT